MVLQCGVCKYYTFFLNTVHLTARVNNAVKFCEAFSNS